MQIRLRQPGPRKAGRQLALGRALLHKDQSCNGLGGNRSVQRSGPPPARAMGEGVAPPAAPSQAHLRGGGRGGDQKNLKTITGAKREPSSCPHMGVPHRALSSPSKGRQRPVWDIRAHEGHKANRHIHSRVWAESPRHLDNATEPKREGCRSPGPGADVPGRVASGDPHTPHTPTCRGVLLWLDTHPAPHPLPPPTLGGTLPEPDTTTSSKPPQDQCPKIDNHPQQCPGSEPAGLWGWPLGLLFSSNEHAPGDRPSPPAPDCGGAKAAEGLAVSSPTPSILPHRNPETPVGSPTDTDQRSCSAALASPGQSELQEGTPGLAL